MLVGKGLEFMSRNKAFSMSLLMFIYNKALTAFMFPNHCYFPLLHIQSSDYVKFHNAKQ